MSDDEAASGIGPEVVVIQDTEQPEEGGEQPEEAPAQQEVTQQEATQQEAKPHARARSSSPSSTGSEGGEKEGEGEGEQQEQTDAATAEEGQPQPQEQATSEQPPAEPEKPAEQEQPPAEPEKPAEQEQPPAEPEKPAEQEQPPAEPEKPAEQEQPPAEPEKPAEEVQAVTEDQKTAEGGEEGVTVEVAEGRAEGGEEPKPKEERPRSPSPGAAIKYGEYLRQMQVGADFTKVKKNKGYSRVYRLEEDLLGITWNSRTKKGSRARIGIKQLKEVRPGRNTDSFKQYGAPYPEDHCFSLIYIDGGKFKTLDVAAMSAADAVVWVAGLQALLQEEGEGAASRSKVRERWLRDLFEEADKNGDGTLDLKEVIRMMNALNVGISHKVLKQKFKEADTEGNYDGKLDFEEFCSLFKELATRPELKRLFSLYSSRKEWLTCEDLRRFLETEQGMDDPTPEFCTNLLQKYEPTDEGKAQGLMSIDGFTQFMLGPENDIFCQEHSKVFQDMTQSLSYYFIASSHNTYLLEDQLRGPSSVEAYIRALRKGCRCVELDCWDGDDGDPVIYHGHTLTSKILFKDAIVAIKEHSFATSPYPVILSIENHCSIPQQHKMAEYMAEIFGDMLYRDSVDESKSMLPSPEELKFKILIKGKKLKKELEEMDEDGGEVSDEDEAADIDAAELRKAGLEPEAPPTSPKAEKKEEHPQQVEAAAAEPPKEEPKEGEKKEEGAAEKKEEQPTEGEQKAEEGKKEGEEAQKAEEGKKEGEEAQKAEEGKKEGEEAQKAEEPPKKDQLETPKKPRRTLSFTRRQKKAAQPAAQAKKIKLSAKLSKCVNYVQSIHFKGFGDSELENAKYFHMSSFSEGSASKHSQQIAHRFVMYNRRQLSRIYPAGTRVNSSNYDPVHMWNCGCQIVALNYQTPGTVMDLNDGKFLQNGKCGYILKPEIMREEISRFDHNQRHAIPGVRPKLLTLKVVSGQHLPKPEGGSKTGEIIDPYVVIEIVGIPEDKQEAKTKAVDDNGFNPVWNEVFHFVVKFPELAIVRFRVMDKDWGPNRDDFVGQFSLPFESISPGYRHIHLERNGDRLENATLLVHIETQDYIAGPTKAQQKGKVRIKKSREYPVLQLVNVESVDTQFRASMPHLHRATDLQEDYALALLHFKESCGRGPHTLLQDCVELMAARAQASGMSLSVTTVGEDTAVQVYRIAVATEQATVSSTLLSIMAAFNQLNTAIQAALTHAESEAEELDKIYAEAQQHQGDVKEHLQQIGAQLKKADQVMGHYCVMMRTIKAEADQLRKLKNEAAANLQKLFAATQKFEIELKTAL